MKKQRWNSKNEKDILPSVQPLITNPPAATPADSKERNLKRLIIAYDIFKELHKHKAEILEALQQLRDFIEHLVNYL